VQQSYFREIIGSLKKWLNHRKTVGEDEDFVVDDLGIHAMAPLTHFNHSKANFTTSRNNQFQMEVISPNQK